MLQFALVYLAVLLGMSAATTLAYWFDKRRALAGARRFPEKVLHAMAFLGGWPGALVAQRRLRHKTRKVNFQVVFWLLVVAHLAVVGGLAYLLFARLSPS